MIFRSPVCYLNSNSWWYIVFISSWANFINFLNFSIETIYRFAVDCFFSVVENFAVMISPRNLIASLIIYMEMTFLKFPVMNMPWSIIIWFLLWYEKSFTNLVTEPSLILENWLKWYSRDLRSLLNILTYCSWRSIAY